MLLVVVGMILIIYVPKISAPKANTVGMSRTELRIERVKSHLSKFAGLYIAAIALLYWEPKMAKYILLFLGIFIVWSILKSNRSPRVANK
jgi:hypothetical protein